MPRNTSALPSRKPDGNLTESNERQTENDSHPKTSTQSAIMQEPQCVNEYQDCGPRFDQGGTVPQTEVNLILGNFSGL